MTEHTNKPLILLRADGGHAIGLGHIKRCETLARNPALSSCRIQFLTTEEPFVIDYLHQRGFETATIPPATDREGMMRLTLDAVKAIRPNMVFIDIINTELFLTRGIREAGIHVVSIDDLGPGAAGCDAVTGVDHGVMPELLPDEVRAALGDRIYAGPDFAIIDPRFDSWRNVKTESHMKSRRALLTFGGSDPYSCTRNVVSVLLAHPGDFHADVVIGPYVKDKPEILDLVARDPKRFIAHVDPPDLPRLMAEASFALCGAGQTLFELSMLGCPAILISQSPLHETFCEDFQRYGSSVHVGNYNGFSKGGMIEWFDRLLGDREQWVRMHEAARRTIDGRGTHRVAELLINVMRG